jgi:hypothetical protein
MMIRLALKLLCANKRIINAILIDTNSKCLFAIQAVSSLTHLFKYKKNINKIN